MAERLLVIGKGAREHALVMAARQSPFVDDIFIAPGSDKTGSLGINIPYATTSSELPQYAKDHHIGLALVGPEEPLVLGMVDRFQDIGIPTYGPNRLAAKLEGSKAHALSFMDLHSIPHPESFVFSSYHKAQEFIESPPWPLKDHGLVLKLDGLAGGKGVVVTDNTSYALRVLSFWTNQGLWHEGTEKIVIQKQEYGFEVSAMAVVDGDQYAVLPYSRDHKRLKNFNMGPNTGGMGVIAPHPLVTPELAQEIEGRIIKPTVQGLVHDNIYFCGTLYPGLIVTDGGVKVLEYNVRFGDPEAEAVFPLLQGQIYPLIRDASFGNLKDHNYCPPERYCVVVTLASLGYPEKPTTGQVIQGLDAAYGRDDVFVFHAGTRKLTPDSEMYVTAGGRVLAIAGMGNTVEAARKSAYSVIGPQGIFFDGMQYRTDIGVE